MNPFRNLRVDPVWLARVEESARNFAKACDSFKEGVKDGLRQERERKFKEAVERDHRARVGPPKTSPDEDDNLQPHWNVKCVDCGLVHSIPWRTLSINPYDVEVEDPDEEMGFWHHFAGALKSQKRAAERQLLKEGWVPRGCGRWNDAYRCFGCATMAINGD